MDERRRPKEGRSGKDRRSTIEQQAVRAGQHDGEELSEIQIALIAVIEGDAPDKFVFGGDVTVFDHAVVLLSTELPPDVAFDEAMRQQRRARR